MDDTDREYESESEEGQIREEESGSEEGELREDEVDDRNNATHNYPPHQSDSSDNSNDESEDLQDVQARIDDYQTGFLQGALQYAPDDLRYGNDYESIFAIENLGVRTVNDNLADNWSGFAQVEAMRLVQLGVALVPWINQDQIGYEELEIHFTGLDREIQASWRDLEDTRTGDRVLLDDLIFNSQQLYIYVIE